MRGSVAAATIALATALTGCSSPPRGFDSPEPAERLHAVAAAARTGDTTAIPHLIELLDSDDAAVRMLSIRTLESMTGQTLGYEHAAPAWARKQAVERWVSWYAQTAGSAADQTATLSSDGT